MIRKLLAASCVLAMCAGLPSLAQDSNTVQESPKVSEEALLSDTSDDLKAVVDKVYPAFVLFMNEGGSGVCISPDGYVLTNHHVASRATAMYERGGRGADELKLRVNMPGNSKQFTALPVGADPRGDIVLLKLDLEEGQTVPYVEIGDSDLVQVGDICVAVGNPFLLSGVAIEPSVSAGVVTSTGRYQGGYSDCIQIDAPINPGNSGGPTFNIDGELIGINGRILTRHALRYNTGTGFAISAAQLKRFLPVFKAQPGGAVVVRHGLVSGLAIQHKDFDAIDGALVRDVRQNSTAWLAGFRKGDVITHVHTYRITNPVKFYGKLGTWPQNAEVDFTVLRNGESMTFTATLDVPVVANQVPTLPIADETSSNSSADQFEDNFAFYDAPPQARMVQPSPFRVRDPSASLGVMLKPWFDDFGNPMGWVVESMITKFPGGGFASSAGDVLQRGDVLTHINGRPIRYGVDISDSLAGFKPGQAIEVTVEREGVSETYPLSLGYNGQ